MDKNKWNDEQLECEGPDCTNSISNDSYTKKIYDKALQEIIERNRKKYSSKTDIKVQYSNFIATFARK